MFEGEPSKFKFIYRKLEDPSLMESLDKKEMNKLLVEAENQA